MARFFRYLALGGFSIGALAAGSTYVKQMGKPKVAVLRLSGLIQSDVMMKFGDNSLNLESLYKSLDRTFAMKELKEVCLVINSPGGSPVQSELIANRIMHLSKLKNVNVVSFVEDYGASGGYWLACAGTEIYTANNSLVGSIGVISATFGLDKLIKNYDIDRRVYTTGKNKSMMDPFQPETPEHKEIVDRQLNRMYANFCDFVKQQRGSRLKADDDVLFTGECWVGEDTVSLGLTDGVKTLSDYLHEKYGGEPSIIVRRINPRSGLFPFLSTGVLGTSFSDIEHDLFVMKNTFL